MKQNMNALKQSVLLFATLALMLSCRSTSEEKHHSSVDDTSWALIPFTKVDSINPILTAGTNTFQCPMVKDVVSWDEKDVFNPAAVVKDGKVYMLFRAEDKVGKYAGTSRIGLAESTDGLRFTKMSKPVLFPDNDSLKIWEWEGGIEDPRVVVSEDGTYIMTYTAYDGKVARLLLATSKDLLNWTKYGRVLKGRYGNAWSKSGAIVSRRDGSKVIATKINGKYWMYFGDTDLFIASSDDLLNWSPLEDNGQLKSVLRPRPGYFDSRLVESGPFALSTPKGIVLIYNGMNLDTGGDSTLAGGAYCSGQALFSAADPSQLIDRLENNFMKPDQPYEIEGQINQVCFVEGLVPFNGKWYLYYGTADSRIAVATSPE